MENLSTDYHLRFREFVDSKGGIRAFAEKTLIKESVLRQLFQRKTKLSADHVTNIEKVFSDYDDYFIRTGFSKIQKLLNEIEELKTKNEFERENVSRVIRLVSDASFHLPSEDAPVVERDIIPMYHPTKQIGFTPNWMNPTPAA